MKIAPSTSQRGESNYFQIVTEIAKGGLENITIRPVAEETEESGLRLTLVDFSVNGFRFAHSDELLSYVLPENKRKLHLDEQVELLKERMFVFNIYPRMRFNRETEGHRPQLPRKISVIGRIVRSEIA